jgi:hypothetical protein
MRSGPAPTPTVAVSQQAAQNLEDKIQSAAATAVQSGQVTVTLTDQEVTSYLQLRLDPSVQAQLPVSNAQVRFSSNGLMILSGDLKNSPIAVKPSVSLSAAAENGQVVTKVVKADFGPVPVPPGTLDSVNQQVQDSLNAQLHQVPGNFQVTGVTISQGQMTVTGTVQE